MTDLARRSTITAFRRPTGSYQRGAALVFSLVILLILTILGISAMRTSSLEQIMTGNTQESTRALQAADSGAGIALNAMTAVHPSQFIKPASPYSLGAASAEVWAPVRRQFGSTQARDDPPSAQDFCFAFYRQQATGSARLNATANIEQGLRSPAPPDPHNPNPCS